jgi:hypothetical protein
MPDRSVLPRPSLSVPGTADPPKPVAHVCYCVLANFGLLPFYGLTCPGTTSMATVLPFLPNFHHAADEERAQSVVDTSFHCMARFCMARTSACKPFTGI